MKPLGILGGGQLARMLVLEAHRLNLPVAVLSPLETDPARDVTGRWVQGDPSKLKDLTAFMKLCSSVTFESEFFDSTLIAKAMKDTKVQVFPDPKIMGLLQDRLSQKNLFDEYDIPTAPWRPVDSSQDALVAYVALDGEAVFKKRRGGYDGYGTFVVRDDGALGSFANSGVKGSFIAEKWIKFKREIAIIAVRDQAGAVFFYPFVESHQKNSRCLWVKGPLRETRAFTEMKKKIAKFLTGLQYVGAMGIEMFETSQGLIVNEIAPRVHNTGHYTMDAFSLSQFSLHLRAVAGLRTQGFAIPRAKSFAMWNLLGSEKSHRGAGRLTPWLAKPAVGEKSSSEATVHWYGKADSRPGRKLGHVNAQAKTPDIALKLAKSVAAQTVKDIGY
jgi:5-(carboxyamino)imidazole ribonucleotide synthase